LKTVRELILDANTRINLASDKDTHFTGAIIQNATEEENLTGLTSNKITITKIVIQADQALDFAVLLFGKDTFDATDLDTDSFQSFVELDLSAHGIQIGATGQYYFDLSDLSIDYIDEDSTDELHIALLNKSATSKTAGAAGEVKITITYTPTVG